MFWTDYGFDSPRIERADLTGENRRSLVSFGYDWYFAWFPMSVVVDYNHDPDRIIWMDRYDNYIDFSDFEGSATELGFIRQNIRPADLAVYGDILYWADENSRSIEWFNMTQPINLHYNFGHLTNGYLVGIVVSDKSRQPFGKTIHLMIMILSALNIVSDEYDTCSSCPISFPEPTCLLVRAKTRSSGIISFQTPRF